MNKLYLDDGVINSKRKYKFMEEYFLKRTPRTYYENTLLQCDSRKGRSFNDLFALYKGRFSTGTKKELARILIDLCSKEIVSCVPCGTLQDLAFHSTLVNRYSRLVIDNKMNLSNEGYLRYDFINNPKSITVIDLFKIAKYEYERK